MCELLGFSAAREEDISEYLGEFFSHSRKHPHGWGMMYGEDQRIIKGVQRASDSEVLAGLLEDMKPQKTTLAHIRFATVGSVRYENCHPFSAEDVSGRAWTMIHNGTIYSSRNSYKYVEKQKGNTDSERLFLAFMDMMNAQLAMGAVSERERFALVDAFVAENAQRNKLNLMLYDSELLYAHKNLKNTLSFKRTKDGVLISTVPLDREGWIPFPMTQLIAFRDGNEVYRGERHKGEFIPSLDYINAMDAMNI